MFKDRGNPSGIFCITHIIILTILLIIVAILLYFSLKLSKEKIKKISKITIIIISILELIKIIYNFIYGYFVLEYWLPLSYCAIFILAMWFASFGKGNLEKLGNDFIACSFIAGLGFLVFPVSSLNEVPWYHYLALYSFLYHSTMLYFGILYTVKVVDKVDKSVFLNHLILVLSYSVLALLLNSLFDINLMFVSKAVEIPITFVYNFLNRIGKFLFILIIYIYIFFPYLFAYILSLVKNKASKKTHSNI